MKKWNQGWWYVLAAFLVFAHWGCQDGNPNSISPHSPFLSAPSGPNSTPTPSGTASPSPVCNASPVTLPNITVYSGGMTFYNPPPASSTPATVFNGVFSYSPTEGFVLRNMSDWDAFYGTSTPPTPPVDFNTQMILVVVYQGCFDQVQFLSVCEGTSGVTALIHDYQGGPHCNLISTPGETVAAAVTNSSMPVTWPVTIY